MLGIDPDDYGLPYSRPIVPLKIENTVKVYPNPATMEVNILTVAEEVGDVSFELFDMLGCRVKFIKWTDGMNFHTFSTDGLKAGFYTYRVVAGISINETGKLVVSK